MKTTAIVLAAGKGKRMLSEVPKQYMEICGKPILYYSLKAFEDSCIDEIILITASDEINYCQEEIVKKFGFKKVVHVIAGGRERYDSVYSGLIACEDADYVFIHDGARPFITKEEIKTLLLEVQRYDACVAGMPVKDTIKIVDNNNNVVETPKRENVWMIQTPQVFKYSLIKDAYDALNKDSIKEVTDDAMVLEKYSNRHVKVVKLSYRNIKITTPEDILIAETLLKPRKNEKCTNFSQNIYKSY